MPKSDLPVVPNNPDLWLSHFPLPDQDSNKYTRGHALIYGGAVMTGAARLAARAAQRMGAGLVTLAAPEVAFPIYSSALESVIIRAVNDALAWNDLLNDEKKTAVLIGPGMGIGHLQMDMILAALETGKACVLDADALTNFSEVPDILFSKLHARCVLTPHEGEFARLFRQHINLKQDRKTRAMEAAALTKAVVLLKGAETVIASADGQMALNTNAPPWLATAGAGDVLAGMILGLLAQKMPVFMAAAAGAWIHGESATKFGPGLIAEDIISGIPDALKCLSQSTGIV